MRQFKVMYQNHAGVFLGVLKMGVALSDLEQLPQHVRVLGDKAFAGQWAQAKVQGLNLVVLPDV